MSNKKSNKKRIKSDISRVFRSEILPYEIPLIFNNDTVIYKKTNYKSLDTIPYQFKTYQNGKERVLSIPHPNVQQQIVQFYDEYYSLILYYTNISKFSIRKPIKKASMYFFDDIIHTGKKRDEKPFKEQDEYEYEKYHSFFVYRKYQFIHQFYKSKDFQNNEKRFPRLLKFDISRCFDTIYTHSISWAIYGQNHAKKNKQNDNFAKIFDCLMQNCNYRETNGIIIGSEFSRLFAEIILQRVDKQIEQKLDIEYNLKYKKDYVLYRYVDDFFLFCDPKNQEKIMSIIKDELAFYKLYINDKKTIEYDRPFVSEQTRLKSQIQEILSKEFRVSTIEKIEESNEKYRFNTRSINVITSLKIIVSNSEDKYDGVSNYILKICEKWITKIFNIISSQQKKYDIKDVCDIKDVVESILNILDIMFFVVSDIRYSSGNYIARILAIIMSNLSNPIITKSKFFTQYYKQVIFNKIYEEILLLMSYQDKTKFYVEYWNLFIILAQLRKSYRLTEIKLKDLIDFDNVIKDVDQNKFRYDFFAITTILFYIKNISMYDDVKTELIEYSNKYLEYLKMKYSSIKCENITEYIFLQQEIEKFNNTVQDIQQHNQKALYIKWKNFKFIQEVDKKQRKEVY